MTISLIMESIRKWADLTAQEEELKLRKLGELLKEYSLDHIQPISTDHQVNLLKSGFAQKQSKLMIVGKVKPEQAGQVKLFTQRAKQEVLGDINQYTYLIRIDVQPVAIGDILKEVESLLNLMSGEEVTLKSD